MAVRAVPECVSDTEVSIRFLKKELLQINKTEVKVLTKCKYRGKKVSLIKMEWWSKQLIFRLGILSYIKSYGEAS